MVSIEGLSTRRVGVQGTDKPVNSAWEFAIYRGIELCGGGAAEGGCLTHLRYDKPAGSEATQTGAEAQAHIRMAADFLMSHSRIPLLQLPKTSRPKHLDPSILGKIHESKP